MAFDVLVDLTPLDTSSRFSGTGRYVHELGRALGALTPTERRGLAIGAVTALGGPQPLGPLDWPGSAAPVRRSEIGWLVERRLRLPLTLRRQAPRLFHAPYPLGTPRGSFVPRVVTCLDLIALVLHRDYLPRRPIYRRMLQAVEARRFHSARRVLAISQHTADDLMRLCGVGAAKIDVVHLGVDLARYRPCQGEQLAAARAVRARYGLRDEGYLFHLGGADPRKNVDVLVAAFAAAKVDGLELVIMGRLRPSDARAIDRALAAAGHPPGVRRLGFVPEPELPAIMAGAFAFVFCSSYEGFGNVPVEAMACGCPVVSTTVTSLRETVAGAALAIAPRDVAATADAIRRLDREPTLRSELRAAGLARAARFDWRATALGTVSCYEHALR